MSRVVSIDEYKRNKRKREQLEEELIFERQYEEFISLLNYFISTQEVETEFITIDFSNEEVQLFDCDDNKIILENGDTEDVLISTLITRSPRRVFIKNDRDCSISDTIKKIYGDRFEMV